MMLITIREQVEAGAQNAVISFGSGAEFPISVSNPFSAKQEAELEWYFEHYLERPYMDELRAGSVEAGIRLAGEQLFAQVFAPHDALAAFRQARDSGEALRITVCGSVEFQALHWEAMRDPQDGQPLCLLAGFVRSMPSRSTVPSAGRPSTLMNLLLVTSRPGGRSDVGYRTIARPLVQSLSGSGLAVNIDMVRPGTFEAFKGMLEQATAQYGEGYYHVVHFDMHGALLDYSEYFRHRKALIDSLLRSRQNTWFGSNLKPYKGLRAFLLFEAPQEGSHVLVESEELAQLLSAHAVRAAILNACQSAKQGFTAAEASLASHLAQAGVGTVLAMGYSVTVSAAELLMREFYTALTGPRPHSGTVVSTALIAGRRALAADRTRKALFGLSIALDDWMLPVLYEDGTADQAWPEPGSGQQQTAPRATMNPAVAPTHYGFFGRDLDILAIEKRLLEHNILLLRGMGGSGKTTLLRHVAAWWQATGFVEHALFFEYDKRAWSLQQIALNILESLPAAQELLQSFSALEPAELIAELGRVLSESRCLLVFDNLETASLGNPPLADALPQHELTLLQSFIAGLRGGRCLVLLGSRSEEQWLAPETFGDNMHELAGLDPQAVSELLEQILRARGATHFRDDPVLRDLLEELDGLPLALQVILSQLESCSPAELLAELQQGGRSIDFRGAADKSASIHGCIDYAYSRLDAAQQQLLLCLAPFSGVINTAAIPKYLEALSQQPALEELPFGRWNETLAKAANWGLAREHPRAGFMLELHPLLPYYLRSHFRSNPALSVAILRAFCLHYSSLSGWMMKFQHNIDANRRQAGQMMVRLESGNATYALKTAVQLGLPLQNYYMLLSHHYNDEHDDRRGLALAEEIHESLRGIPAESLSEDQLADHVLIMVSVGRRQLKLLQLDASRRTYGEALELIGRATACSVAQRLLLSGNVYFGLGCVAQEEGEWDEAVSSFQRAAEVYRQTGETGYIPRVSQRLGDIARTRRQWQAAEQYYLRALEELGANDVETRAAVLHQLGWLSHEMERWDEARVYYLKALRIHSDYGNRFSMGGVYHQLGNLEFVKEHWAAAREYYQREIEICIEFSDQTNLAVALFQLSQVELRLGNTAQCEQYLRRALAIQERGGDHLRLWEIHHQFGELAALHHDPGGAESSFRTALEHALALNYDYGRASTLLSLGDVWLDNSQAESARSAYGEALELLTALDDRDGMLNAAVRLGELALAEARWDSAGDHFLIALEMAGKEREGLQRLAQQRLAVLWKEHGLQDLLARAAAVLEIDPRQTEALFESLLADAAD